MFQNVDNMEHSYELQNMPKNVGFSSIIYYSMDVSKSLLYETIRVEKHQQKRGGEQMRKKKP